MTKKRISKSTLSMFLRTKCDRELYLSLHEDSELNRNGMPVPLQARPGIGVLQTAGRDFEDERNDQLVQAFGNLVIYQSDKAGTNKPVKAPLASLLGQVSTLPSIILQGKFEPSLFQNRAMASIGLQPTQIALVPPIAGLIPDIIVVRQATTNDEEVCANGYRKSINLATETRSALSIIDVKHTSEANPSYSAEVALYALFLANWITDQGLQDRYFVATNSYLWTRFKQGKSELDRLMSGATAVTPNQFLDALIADSEDANLRFYLPTVLHFFREDLLRVITVGDGSPGGWENLEWHVDGRCSSCDWLGHEKWANSKDKDRIAAQPTHYCYPAAKLTGHLSQIAGMTRGARKTLQIHAIHDTAGAAVSSSAHPAFQQHTHLKKEQRRIPARASALLSSTTTVDNSSVLASLAPAPQLHVSIAANFDPSAGMLTGMSILGRATTYTSGQPPRQFAPKCFVVDQKSLVDEWVALEGLLSTLSDMVDQAELFVRAAGKTPLTAQIAFWERRQFEELCAAMGRHLPRVLSLTNRKTKALAWLFPADELIEKPDGAVSPCIVFIDEIVRRVVFAPTPHVITLLDTAETYYSGSSPVRLGDAYYREFLTNGIPRERIYEIWSNVAVIKRGSVAVPRNTVIQEFGNAMQKQCSALNSVVERLRSDFKGQLKANAPKLTLSIPQGSRDVAFDSKLWVWWEELQFQTKKLESHQRIALDAETLEASYEAVRLTNGQLTAVPSEYIFDVLTGSTEAKLDDNEGYLALGKEGYPGLPLQRGRDLIPIAAPVYSGHSDSLITPLWAALSVTLVSFDRSARKAVVRFSNWRDAAFAPYLLANSAVDLLNDVFITKGQGSFKWYETVKKILASVGNPPIAVADSNAAIAMGASATRPGTAAITPLARILWEADTVHANSIVGSSDAASVAAYAKTKHNLNTSQTNAVAHASEKGLTIIWGPPGTGKTQTLAGCIHGLAHDSVQRNQSLKVLVAGPTYKAVEELVGRVVESLDADPACPAEVFVGYSSSQTPKAFAVVNPHLRVESFNLDQNNQETNDCLASLASTQKVTIVATSTMQAYKFALWACGSCVGPVFDVVIVDESSQVQVTTAISPLATLKEDGRLIVAGDHLQMPPIMALEPPKGAEYLVGSIQKYLLNRPFGNQIIPCPLEENYRSAEDIVAYARTIGYRATLQPSNPATALHLLAPAPTPASGFPVASMPWSTLWPHILAPENKVLTLLHDDDLSSQSNSFEAKIVAALTWCIRKTASVELDGRGSMTHAVPQPDQFWTQCIGIVTPHRAQRALVLRELRAMFPSDPVDLIDSAVDTVEKFQGGQRHTIIVTFGVGDADVIMGEEAFLMQLERTNVAISRAMAKCLVVMPMTLAGHVPQDKKALETAHAIKQYVDEFCNKEINGQISLGSKLRQAKLRYHQ